jgi:hypothetical protein
MATTHQPKKAMKAEILDIYQLLVNVEEEAKAAHEALVAKFKLYSLLIGGACGIFVQLSTLGANVLTVSMRRYEDLDTLHPKEAMVFSLTFSFFTSCMALLILALLRGLVGAVWDTNPGPACRPDKDMLIRTLEVRYVVGALFGVCAGWTFTDSLLGMQSMALYSLTILAAALVWTKIMIWIFPARSVNGVQEEVNEQKPVMRAISVHVV